MERQADWDKIIIGIDPGTNVMGYGILGVRQRKPELIAMGVIMLSKFDDRYMRLRRIAERVTGLVEQYLPDEMALEAPFYGKNVQSMLKLGRAPGAAMLAALEYGITSVHEYAPREAKQAITGNGAASKEQVAEMLRRILNIPREAIDPHLDATDALGVALCHFYESQRPVAQKSYSSWKDFVARNADKVAKH